jgi:hypothetical protein
MSELVTWLRDTADADDFYRKMECAKKIEQLEAALRKITSDELYNEAQMAAIADEALHGEQDTSKLPLGLGPEHFEGRN